MANMLKLLRKSSDAAHVRKTESITIYIDGSNLSCTTFPFFLFFLKNLSYSFAGLRKSHTFALAKREQLLQTGGVGFPTQ